MPTWAWALVFAGIFLVGAAFLTNIALDLKRKAQRFTAELSKVTEQVNLLSEAAKADPNYVRPVNNVLDNPIATTEKWLKRKRATEQRKLARQRSLISRLNKRK